MSIGVGVLVAALPSWLARLLNGARLILRLRLGLRSLELDLSGIGSLGLLVGLRIELVPLLVPVLLTVLVLSVLLHLRLILRLRSIVSLRRAGCPWSKLGLGCKASLRIVVGVWGVGVLGGVGRLGVERLLGVVH